MAEYRIKVSSFWSKEETDLSKCTGCNEIIFCKMNVLIIQYEGMENINFSNTDICLCQSCFDASSFND